MGRRARRQASETTASMEPSSIMHASGTANAAAADGEAIDAADAGAAPAANAFLHESLCRRNVASQHLKCRAAEAEVWQSTCW